MKGDSNVAIGGLYVQQTTVESTYVHAELSPYKYREFLEG